jgi:hypothetical protein
VTTNNIENDQKSEAKKTRDDRRSILTKTERAYILEGRPKDRGKEYMIKLKTKKALHEDLPLIAQFRTRYLSVVTGHDEMGKYEHPTTEILEQRLRECILQLYWVYEAELAGQRKKAKVKSRVSEKQIFKKINAKVKESKANVHEILEGIRKWENMHQN